MSCTSRAVGHHGAVENEELQETYEPPAVIVLGTVADMTESVASGPNFDLSDFAPSQP